MELAAAPDLSPSPILLRSDFLQGKQRQASKAEAQASENLSNSLSQLSQVNGRFQSGLSYSQGRKHRPTFRVLEWIQALSITAITLYSQDRRELFSYFILFYHVHKKSMVVLRLSQQNFVNGYFVQSPTTQPPTYFFAVGPA